jgi:hypothetical protein
VPHGAVKLKVYQTVTIPAHTIKLVKVQANWKEGQSEGFIDRAFGSHQAELDIFAIADSLISRNNPKIQILNFSDKPIKLSRGKTLGYMRDPSDYLAKESTLTNKDKLSILKYAQLVKALARNKPEEKPTPKEEELSRSPEGGPKTTETPYNHEIPTNKLLKEVHFSEYLTTNQQRKLEEIVAKHEKAFGLDGRLGMHNAQVEINLRPNMKEISLAPYSASPAKQEVIDKQVDDWLCLDVIKPAKSAWGFPVIVVYRNSKPRVCIDYRRLNEVSLPNKYPLP